MVLHCSYKEGLTMNEYRAPIEWVIHGRVTVGNVDHHRLYLSPGDY